MKLFNRLFSVKKESTGNTSNISNSTEENQLREHYSNNGAKRTEMYEKEGIEPPKELNTEIIKRDKVPNTPFEYINKGDGWFIGMSPFILTPTFKSKHEAKLHLESNKWNTIVNLMTSLLHYNNELQANKNSK